MRSKILKEVLDNATPEVIARVNQISNDLLIEKLRKENEKMRAMLKEAKEENESLKKRNDYIKKRLNKLK